MYVKLNFLAVSKSMRMVAEKPRPAMGNDSRTPIAIELLGRTTEKHWRSRNRDNTMKSAVGPYPTKHDESRSNKTYADDFFIPPRKSYIAAPIPSLI
jgi:hypothetical protein